MKRMERVKELVSKKIVDISANTVKNTVGKSYPLFAHEVKMPEGLKEALSDK